MTSEENPALALFKSSHDEMREVIKLKSNGQLTTSSPMNNGLAREEEDPAITKFREYIRIETVQPNPDNAGAMKFLASYAEDLGLPYFTHECVPGKPIMIMTWKGEDPSLSSIILNSHTDVVPVFPEHWTHPPFSAHKDEQGNIYGRGTQDMKCVGIQHLEAIRKLRSQGKRMKRTIHLTFVPDEEIGGIEGMAMFVKSSVFKDLNVGFSLDEGLAGVDDEIPLYFGERNVFWIKVTCNGSPGHGSRFLENTAAEKARQVINKLLDFRAQEKKRLELDSELTLGDVTTVNFTMCQGGVQVNVVPDKFILNFDMRITPTTDIREFEDRLRGWLAEAGSDIDLDFLVKFTDQSLTSVDPQDPWYEAMTRAFTKHGLKVRPQIFPAGTDSRYLREVGIPAIGFSPMPHTPVLLHDHNEFLNEDVFLRGIEVFVDIIENVANVEIV